MSSGTISMEWNSPDIQRFFLPSCKPLPCCIPITPFWKGWKIIFSYPVCSVSCSRQFNLQSDYSYLRIRNQDTVMHLFLSFFILFFWCLPHFLILFFTWFPSKFPLEKSQYCLIWNRKNRFVYISAAVGLSWEVRSPLSLGVGEATASRTGETGNSWSGVDLFF